MAEAGPLFIPLVFAQLAQRKRQSTVTVCQVRARGGVRRGSSPDVEAGANRLIVPSDVRFFNTQHAKDAKKNNRPFAFFAPFVFDFRLIPPYEFQPSVPIDTFAPSRETLLLVTPLRRCHAGVWRSCATAHPPMPRMMINAALDCRWPWKRANPCSRCDPRMELLAPRSRPSRAVIGNSEDWRE